MSEFGKRYLTVAAPANGAQLHKCWFGTMVIHPTVNWPIFNWAMVDGAGPDLSTVRKEFAARGLNPSLLLWSDQQADLCRELGLSKRESHTVLQVEKHRLVKPPSFSREDLTVENPHDIELWLDTLLRGFAVPENLAPRFHSAHSHLYSGDPRAHLFLARAGDQCAGAALLWIAEGIACLHTASVLPAFRGCGVYRALTAARIREAVRHDVACLATESAVPSVINTTRELGFAPAGHYDLWY